MARRFRFRLEALLRVRRLREREAKRKVAAQRAEIARLDQLDAATRREIAARQAELLCHQRSGRLDPLAVARTRAWILHLQQTITERAALRARLLAALERLTAEFHAARRELRIIEKLRQRRLAEYRRQRQRAEQAASDEMARQLQTHNLTTSSTGIEG
jgi:flagellar FliJ protein